MNKQEIIQQKSSLITWAESLGEISDDLWFSPFAPGKWGTADVIAHFISWDQLMIDNRLTFILKNEAFPKVEVDVEKMNKEASNYARSGVSKEELIQKFINTREQLVNLLSRMEEQRYSQPIFKNKEMTLSEYLVGLIHHDQKHKEQIDLHIGK